MTKNKISFFSNTFAVCALWRIFSSGRVRNPVSNSSSPPFEASRQRVLGSVWTNISSLLLVFVSLAARGGLTLTISSSHKHAERRRLPPFLILAYFRCPSCCYQGCSAAHVSQSCNQRFFFWPVLPCSHSHTAQKTTRLLHENFFFFSFPH